MLQRYAGWNNDPHPAGAFVRYAEHKAEIAALETRCKQAEKDHADLVKTVRELGVMAREIQGEPHWELRRDKHAQLIHRIAAADALPKGEKNGSA